MSRSSTSEQVCACGTTFAPGAPFCRNCGLKRPVDLGAGTVSQEALRAEVQREFPFQAYIDNAAQRTITLRQLRQVIDYAKRSCSRWSSSASTVPTIDTLDWHQVNQWMIQPATQDKKCAFVELLTSRGQDPLVFVSHWWGEKIIDFTKCMILHAETRALPEDSGAWICVFARRQHSIDPAVVSMDSQQSDMRRALQLASTVLLTLDDRTEFGQAMFFTRIWCLFEVFVALSGADDSQLRKRPLLDMAVVRKKKAELLTDGLAAADCRLPASAGWPQPTTADAAQIEAAQTKARREASFPIEILRNGLTVDVKKAVASVESDRAAILNCWAGRDAGERPLLEANEGYGLVSRRLQAAVAVAMIPQAILKQKTDEVQLVGIISADDRLQSLDLSFVSTGISDSQVSCIARGLPAGLRSLSLDFAQEGIGDSSVFALMSAIPVQLTRLALGFSFTKIGDAGVESLGSKLPRKLKRVELRLAGLSISDACVAKLVQSWPGELEELVLCFSECAGLGDAAVTSLARSGFQSLKVLQLDLSKCSWISRSALEGRGNSANSFMEIASGLAKATALTGLKLLFSDCAAVADASIEKLAKGFPEQLEELELDFSFTSVTDGALGTLAAPLGKLAKLGKLALNFRGCADIGDAGAKALTRAAPAGLKSASLDFGATRISDSMAEELGKLPRSLQSLCLGFAGCTEITEKGFAKVVDCLPNRLSEATLCLAGCSQLGDFGMASLILCLPESLSAIEFQGVPQTSVTPENSFKFKGADRIQEWRRELQATKEYFKTGRILTNLTETLRLDFQAIGSKFGDREMSTLGDKIPGSLNELHLNFNGCTGLTDDALGTLSSSLPQEKLAQLVLSFAGCSKITDAGVGKLAERLPAGVQTFKLNLRSCTGVTDAGTMYIQQNLPSSLATLRLSLEGTRVSEQRRKSLERIEKPQSPMKEEEKRKPYKKEKQQKKKDEEAQKAKLQADEDARLKAAEESRKRATELGSWMTQDYKQKVEEDRRRQEQRMKEEEEARRLADEEQQRRIREEEEAKRRQEEEERRRRQADGELSATSQATEQTQAPEQKVTKGVSSLPWKKGPSSKKAAAKAASAKARAVKAAVAKASWGSVKKKLAPKLDEVDMELSRHLDANGNIVPFLGAYVEVAYCGSDVHGIIRYMGEVNFAPGEWLGVALEQPLSNHDGTMQGVRYFQARPGCGLFVLPSAVQSVKAPGVFSTPKLIPLIDTAVSQGTMLATERSPKRSPGTTPGSGSDGFGARSLSSPSFIGNKSGATSTASSPFAGLSPKSARTTSRSPKVNKALVGSPFKSPLRAKQ